MAGSRSVQRAVQVLSLLAGKEGGRGGLTLSQISTALDIPKASAFDIVHALRATHFLQEDNRRFSIGFMAHEVGEAYEAQTGLCGVARSILMRLADSMGLSTSLVFYEKGGLLYVLQCRPADKVLAAAFEGSTPYLHAAASGKVMLAFMSDAKREKALKGLKFQKFTEKTLLTRRALDAELQKVRAQGFAVDDREYEDLLTCVSAPLFSRNRLAAAVTISGVMLDETRIPAMAQAVREACENIAQELDRKRA
ncbi:MAG: IclR family transcriptional regulator [Desulfovibrionaceae bacterium]